ncbi:MAG: hypothetical protein LBQ20_11955 [Rhodanobacter sp.]|nr:hypothetical protein [Rhodanobacter sp.]
MRKGKRRNSTSSAATGSAACAAVCAHQVSALKPACASTPGDGTRHDIARLAGY